MDPIIPGQVEEAAGAASETVLTIWAWCLRHANRFARIANFWAVLLLWSSVPITIWGFYQLLRHTSSIWLLLLGLLACTAIPIVALLTTIAFVRRKAQPAG